MLWTRLWSNDAFKRLEPADVFVCLGLLFGIPLALVTAPYQAPDEPQHFLRAYQISEGNFLPERRGSHGGGNLPVSLTEVPRTFAHLRFHPLEKTSWQQIRSAMQIPLDPRNRRFIPFVTAIYSPVGYLPQGIAMAMGRHLNLPPLLLMYVAREFNLLAWIIFGFAALRIAPVCGRPLLLLLLMPMSLFQAASMSADATTNGLAVLFTVWIWRLITCNQKERISFISWLGLTVVAVALTVSKFAYLPLSALVLLIPKRRFGKGPRWVAALAVFFATNIAGILLWAPRTGGLNAVVNEEPGVLPRGQIAYLRAHPAAVLTVADRTLKADCWLMVRSFVGRLGSMDTHLHVAFIVAYLIALFLACWSDDMHRPLPGVRKVLAITLTSAALCVCAIALLNYVYWTPMGARQVNGMQGRYLLPLAPAFIFLLWTVTRRMARPPWRMISRRKADLIATGVCALSCSYTLLVVCRRYYYR